MGSRLEKNSDAVRKRIAGHDFTNEEGEEYEASSFGGFGDYMRRKKLKLQNLDADIRAQSSQKPQIFRGIVCHVNGYTQPSLADLHTLIVSHGGGFLQYLEGKTAVTHVIAAQLTPKKKVEFSRYRIVKPAWIVDSVAAGRVLPWNEYRVVDEGVTQKVLGFDNGNIVTQANTQRKGYRDQTDTSWYTSQLRNETGSSQAVQTSLATSARASNIPQPLEDTPVLPSRTDGLNDYANHPEDDADNDAGLAEVQESELEPEEEDEDEDDDGELMKPPPPRIGQVTGQAHAKSESSDKAGASTRELTAEEHNAILLSNPHMAKSSTANPDFINQYYRESRLHHLSTWKADLKAQLQARAQQKSSSQRTKPVPGARRYVLHVDFDSFFAAVSLRQNPHLVDKPVVIAHGSGPGSEIASCNYPARKFGVKNGMWMKNALELCKELNVLPYDFKAYEEASRHFYDSILAVEGMVQSISIDEALIDVSDQCIKAGGTDGTGGWENSKYAEQEKAQQIAQDIRGAVRDLTGCEVSVGIGNNILLAKVALRKAKPAGQHLIRPEDILEFIGELQVTDLPGVAWSIGKKLEEISVRFVKDIRELTKERLTSTLGPKTGQKLWDYSRGIDKQEVGEQVIRKSVSAEINWGIRFINQQQAEDFVQCLCDELSKRLLENMVKGKQMTMKIMRKAADAGMDPPKNLGHGKCDTFNKSIVLGVATTDKALIGKEAISILRSYGFSPGELRGLGVQMQKLEPLKPAAIGGTAIDSSQRRLQFKKPAIPQDNPSIKQSIEVPPVQPPRKRPKLSDEPEPIEEITTPKKSRGAPTIEGAIANSANLDQNRRPLNLGGTQFILPTQVDPTVLAEMPADIRARLAPKQKTLFNSSIVRSSSPSNRHKSRSASPQVSHNAYLLPNRSQLDATVLAEIPEELRQEYLQQYEQMSAARTLPLSPRKPTSAGLSKKIVTPTKKQKHSIISKRGRSKAKSTSTLTQANFTFKHLSAGGPSEESAGVDEIERSFLEALPEELRQELLENQRRQRMLAKGGLDFGTLKRKVKATTGSTNRPQQTLPLPQQAPPTFTAKKLSSVKELQDAMVVWVTGCSTEDVGGPDDEDVAALGMYLSKVVFDEHNMEKAAVVLKWLSQVVEMRDFDEDDPVATAWTSALQRLRDMVQDAVGRRGLPPMDLESA